MCMQISAGVEKLLFHKLGRNKRADGQMKQIGGGVESCQLMSFTYQKIYLQLSVYMFGIVCTQNMIGISELSEKEDITG